MVKLKNMSMLCFQFGYQFVFLMKKDIFQKLLKIQIMEDYIKK